MNIRILEATSPAIAVGSIFTIPDNAVKIGAEIRIKTPLDSYEVEIEKLEILGEGRYKASNSNNVVVFEVLGNPA